MRKVVKGFQRRLTTVERRVMPYECISPDQTTEVRLAVQRLGELLTGKAAGSRRSGEKVPNFYSGDHKTEFRDFLCKASFTFSGG